MKTNKILGIIMVLLSAVVLSSCSGDDEILTGSGGGSSSNSKVAGYYIHTFNNGGSSIELKKDGTYKYENSSTFREITEAGTYSVNGKTITCKGIRVSFSLKYPEDNYTKENQQSFTYYGSYLLLNDDSSLKFTKR